MVKLKKAKKKLNKINIEQLLKQLFFFLKKFIYFYKKNQKNSLRLIGYKLLLFKL